jgi:hypothetical protein
LYVSGRIQREICGGGVCGDSVSLASGDSGLEEGIIYIVSVRASNRYGQSPESEKSEPFMFREDSKTREGNSQDSQLTKGIIIIFMYSSSYPIAIV